MTISRKATLSGAATVTAGGASADAARCLVLKVGHADVAVRGMDSEESDGRDALGMFNGMTMSIVVRNAMAPAKQAEVLIHELLHACFEAYQIKGRGLTEEDVCTRLAPALACVLRDNPALPALLLQGLTGLAIFPAAAAA